MAANGPVNPKSSVNAPCWGISCKTTSASLRNEPRRAGLLTMGVHLQLKRVQKGRPATYGDSPLSIAHIGPSSSFYWDRGRMCHSEKKMN